MITTKIIKDSITPKGNRLTTFELTYPRFIHSEMMTHRLFSRNAASSRAIPIKKMVSAVMAEPAMPVYWGKNQSGMQAGDQLEGSALGAVKSDWLEMRTYIADQVLDLCEIGNLHKQIANRALEPWAHITVILTSSEVGLLNFFHLRAHPDAQPEFQVVAYNMLSDYLDSEPQKLEWDQWHIPMSDDFDQNELTNPWPETILKVCTGRIARISYLTHNGVRDTHEDVVLHDRLSTAGHWSPFEHCAQAKESATGSNFGPFWHQYRKKFENECMAPSREELKSRLENKPSWVTID